MLTLQLIFVVVNLAMAGIVAPSSPDVSLASVKLVPHQQHQSMQPQTRQPHQPQTQRVNALKIAPCDVGYFQCAGGEYCVRQQYNCDDHDDCPDGSDEHNCSKCLIALII